MLKALYIMEQTILIIEDDPMLRDLLTALLISEGAEVSCCENGDAALALAEKRCFDAFIIDYRLPAMTGVEVAKMLRACCPSSCIIGISLASKESEFLQAGADAFLLKPFETWQLISLIDESGAARKRSRN